MTRTTGTGSLVVALVLAGCLAGPGKRCHTDSDCKGGLVCWQYTSTCEEPCEDTSGCEEGETCYCEPDRECRSREDDPVLVDLEGGVCLPPSDDADADVEPDSAPDGVDTVTDTSIPDTEPDIVDTIDMDCGSDGAPDVLADGGCAVPTGFPDPVLYMRGFYLGTDGRPGSGLDLDGDPSTCAPEIDCSDGIDNAMAGLGTLANGYLPGGELGHETHIVMELAGYAEDGCPFTMNFYAGTNTSTTPDDCPTRYPACCPAGRTCDFTIPAESFDADCAALSMMGGLSVTGTAMRGGPTTTPYYLMLSVVGLDLLVPVHEARVLGTVTPGTGGPDRVQAIIGGYVIETEFFAVFEAIPADRYPFPGKDDIITLLHSLYTESLIVNDMDMNGDTVNDAASLGIIFDAEPTHLTGVAG